MPPRVCVVDVCRLLITLVVFDSCVSIGAAIMGERGEKRRMAKGENHKGQRTQGKIHRGGSSSWEIHQQGAPPWGNPPGESPTMDL